MNDSGPQFDQKLKLADVPMWDSNGDTIVAWMQKIDDLSAWSDKVFVQLGNFISKRLTDSAEKWYFSLPMAHREILEEDWDTMREAIAAFYMNRKWWEDHKAKALRATYHEWGHSRETPSEYYICKKELMTLASKVSDHELISEIMGGAPAVWHTVLNMESYETVVQFQNVIRFHEHTLMHLSHPSQVPQFEQPVSFRNPDSRYRNQERIVRTNLAGTSDGFPSPRFPRNDKNILKWRFTPKQKGARPCQHCGSDQHWDPECEHHYKDMKLAHTNMASISFDSSQAKYDDLYYSLDDSEVSGQDFDDTLQTTESTCRLINSCEVDTAKPSALGGESCTKTNENEEKFAPVRTFRVESKNACTSFYEKPALNRKTRRALARSISKTEFTTWDKPGRIDDKSLIELQKLMERPPGCTFLGSKATEAIASVNSLHRDKVKVIIDSGSDITLISQEALRNLSHSPTIQAGQQINLIQVTGSSSISGFIKLDLYFDTEKGPVKINVEAYIVKGMTTPFILGNNFADQYSISIIRQGGESILTFGDTGCELKVSSSTSPTFLDKEGRTFTVRKQPDVSARISRSRIHHHSQKLHR